MDLAQHLALLTKSERSLRLRRALETAVNKGDHVLDAGCGTGLLSVWAAKAGAERVIGIDTMDLQMAREFAHDNGVADRTEFRRCDLRAVDLAEKFQVVTAMIYYNDPRRDEVQSRIAQETYARFLADGGEPIPDKVCYRARGVAWPKQHISQYWHEAEKNCQALEPIYGLEFGALLRGIKSEINPRPFPARNPDGLLESGAATALTESVIFADLDYRAGVIAYPTHLGLIAKEPGRLDSIIWTQELVHRDQIIFSNESISWIDPPVELRAGQPCSLRIDDHWRRTNVITRTD